MQYFISFLEGIITFISPCLLPMLPIYISYFAGGDTHSKDKSHTIKNALGFVLGFTIIFMILGAFAGTIGALLTRHTQIVNVVTGFIVVVFGLNFIGILKISFLNKTSQKNSTIKELGFFSSILFGAVFSVGWTPCVGAFLGSALMLASQQGSATQGLFMLLAYSLGLGIPFVISALLIDKLKSTLIFIKTHYKIINTCSGSILVIIGILMMTGHIGKLLALLTF
ncbi:MAG: cytochrome c biogenesis CcdA family protein [Lachnospiraceae bacterium]